MTMVDKSDARRAKDRAKQWERRGKALPYRWYQRWSDWWCATRDAATGVPAIPDDTSTPSIVQDVRPTIPRIIALGQLGLGWSEREWIAYQAETADLQVDLAQATGGRDQAREHLVDAEARLEKAPDEPADIVTAAGEEDSSDEVHRYRRQRDHAATRRRLADEVSRLRTALTAAELEVSRLDDRVRIRREVAEARVAMIEAYVRRRCAAYLVRLARKHPAGKLISTEVADAWPQKPSWLRGTTARTAEAE